MDILARPPLFDDVGDPLVRKILSQGSFSVITPLVTFLVDAQLHPELRATGRTIQAALLADIAHFMNISHGRHPGVVEYAAQKIVDDAARSWLIQALDGMLKERAFLNMLTVTAGPIRRLTGQDNVNALVESQAKNFQMLATSDRKGCSPGSAIAFVIDWHQTRPLLEIVAHQMGISPPAVILPSVADCAALAQTLERGDSFRRAMAFGAEQTLAQQRGLWQLIVARHVEMIAA